LYKIILNYQSLLYHSRKHSQLYHGENNWKLILSCQLSTSDFIISQTEWPSFKNLCFKYITEFLPSSTWTSKIKNVVLEGWRWGYCVTCMILQIDNP
jgi:hypothetical protein